jgi:hypothetical protein
VVCQNENARGRIQSLPRADSKNTSIKTSP